MIKSFTILNYYFLVNITVSRSAETVEYTDCTSAEGYSTPRNECPGYETKQSYWWGSSNAGALGNAEHSFIALTPRSTPAQSGSTW